MTILRCLALLLTALVAGAPAPRVFAQAYPARPVEFVIPFAPGGPTDTAIRLIQPALSANLGAPVVLVNKAGGGGAIGMDAVAKARPDGYTLALLKQAYGRDIAHVPSAGSGPVKNAILGGHVQVGAAALSPLLSVIRSGDVTPLVTSATRRNPALPTVPTLTEKGQSDVSLS